MTLPKADNNTSSLSVEQAVRMIPALGLVFNEFERQIEKLSSQILSGACASFEDYKGAVQAIRTLNTCVRQGKEIAAKHLMRSDDDGEYDHS